VALLSRFFGRTASEGAAFALGTAVGPALTPAVRELVNEAWTQYPSRPVDAGVAAAIVAEAVELRDWGAGEAVKTGIDSGRFDAMVAEAREAPGVSELLQLWRRGLIDRAAFEHGLAKAKLETRWTGPLEGLHDVLLAPADLAMMRQQGFIDTARQHSESDLQGVTSERADLLFEVSGLPPGVEAAQAALNRGLIDDATFAQIVREGHTKTKYTALLTALRHPVLSATTYATLRLKGWKTQAESDDGGALSGYTSAQMEDLFLSMGRPAAPGQMATAAARGIDGPDGVPMNEAQFLKGIRESDIRPEWGPMLWGSRFLYPPLFQLTRLVQGGAIDADTAARWARFDRYPPEVVTAMHDYWTQPTAPKADTHLGKAQTQLWTTVHRSYVADETSDADAAKTLTTLGVPGATQTEVLKLWKAERALIRKQLTPAQIKKAFVKLVKNPATGQPWTRDDALTALVARGYTLADATTYIDT
jgi:Arc/MetJ family transcription regulator